MSNFALKVAAHTVQKGEVTVFSMGQAGYLIKTASGKLIGLDMYLTDCVERLCNFRRISAKMLAPDELHFDYLLVSHEHPDHFDVDAMPILMANPYTQTITSVCGKKLADSLGIKKNVIELKRGDVYETPDFTVRAVYCNHGELAPYALGFILEIDGFKLYYAGDTCFSPEQVAPFREEHFDLMMAPLNGAFGNLNEEECAKYAAIVQPKLTLPCHFWTFIEHGGDPRKFIEAMEKEAPDQKYLFLTQGEYVTLSK